MAARERKKAGGRATAADDVALFFREIGRQLGEAVGSSMVETLRASLPAIREEMAGAVGARSGSAGDRRAAKVSASLTRPCPVPGCNRPGRGPRFSFLCEVHRDMPVGDRDKYRIRPRRG